MTTPGGRVVTPGYVSPGDVTSGDVTTSNVTPAMCLLETIPLVS